MGETYFARKATGLVRQISTFDSFVFNANFTNAGLAVTWILLYVPSYHPQANIFVATVIAMILALSTALVHAILAGTFPRSGGEYVYVSRILSPMFGFAANWNMSLWFLFYIGIPCALFARYGFSVALRFLGYSSGDNGLLKAANWFASPHGTFVVGTLLLVVLLMISIRGLRVYARVQNGFFIIATLGLAIVVLELVLGRANSVLVNLDRYLTHFVQSGQPRREIVELARTGGFAVSAWGWKETLLILSWPGYFLFWSNASTYIGGEVRDAAKAQLKALPAAVVFCGLWILLVVGAFEHVLGKEFLGALAYAPAKSIGLGFTPTFGELAAAMTGSIAFGLIIVVCVAFWTFVWAPLGIGLVTRNLLAWSLDRLAPMKLSEVHPRFHSPVLAIVLCGVIGEISLGLYAYFPQFALLVGVFGAFMTFILTSLSATILPFRRPAIFDQCAVRKRILRVPMVTILGVLSILSLVGILISLVLDPTTGISIFPSLDAGTGKGVPFFMLCFNIAVFLSGFFVYGCVRAVRKRQGIDVGLAFREIPPE